MVVTDCPKNRYLVRIERMTWVGLSYQTNVGLRRDGKKKKAN